MTKLAGKAAVGGHTNLYGLFVLRALDWLEPGGILGFVLPTSFVAGPYFAGLRAEILDRATVLRIDLHQDREDLFLDAVQDVCLLVLRRHTAAAEPQTSYSLGLIDGSGARSALGTAETPAKDDPWTLPVPGRACTSSVKMPPRRLPPHILASENSFSETTPPSWRMFLAGASSTKGFRKLYWRKIFFLVLISALLRLLDVARGRSATMLTHLGQQFAFAI